MQAIVPQQPSTISTDSGEAIRFKTLQKTGVNFTVTTSTNMVHGLADYTKVMLILCRFIHASENFDLFGYTWGPAMGGTGVTLSCNSNNLTVNWAGNTTMTEDSAYNNVTLEIIIVYKA